MAEKCEAQIADFILNVHDTFAGDLASVKKSLQRFYSGCNVELDARSKKVIVDGRQVGTFTVPKGKPAKSGGNPAARTKPKSARKTTAPEFVTTPGENTPAESQPGGSNESEEA